MIELVIYGIGITLSFYMAWCLGANDAANPTDCAVGAGVIPIKKAVALFAIFAAMGGILLGPFVMRTVDRGMVDRDAGLRSGELTGEMVILGSFTAVLSACLWVTFCTWKGMPVSTSHSIVGGVLGFGLIVSPALIQWSRVHTVFASLVVSPILSLLLACGLFFLLRAYFKKARGRRSDSALIFLLLYIVCFLIFISIFHKILKWDFIPTMASSSLISLIPPTLAILAFLRRYGELGNGRTQAYLLIAALCLSAFAFGANDMANATGVFVTPTEILAGKPPLEATMFLLSIFGAAGIALGGLTWGHRVITTSAYKVTRLDPLTGAAAEYSNLLTVFLFTTVPAVLTGFGMPISTTHSTIGSIIGVGLASRGLTGIHKATTGKILTFWILTIPCVALISLGLFQLFSRVVGI